MSVLVISGILCLAALFGCRALIPKKPKWDTVLIILQFLAGLILGYLAIYTFFFYRMGLPAGENLENKDWLSFLSGYLSFAGSLIMAWLVFKQSTIINEFTIQEYNILLNGVIDDLRLVSYKKEDISNWTILYNGHNYFKYDLCEDSEVLIEEDTLSKYLLCFKLYNMSKLPVKRIHFNAVSIKAFSSDSLNQAKTYYIYSGKNASPFNGTHSIVPNDWVPICFALPTAINFPQKQSCSFEISFSAENIKAGNVFSFVLYCGEEKLTLIDGKNRHSEKRE